MLSVHIDVKKVEAKLLRSVGYSIAAVIFLRNFAWKRPDARSKTLKKQQNKVHAKETEHCKNLQKREKKIQLKPFIYNISTQNTPMKEMASNDANFDRFLHNQDKIIFKIYWILPCKSSDLSI